MEKCIEKQHIFLFTLRSSNSSWSCMSFENSSPNGINLQIREAIRDIRSGYNNKKKMKKKEENDGYPLNRLVMVAKGQRRGDTLHT